MIPGGLYNFLSPSRNKAPTPRPKPLDPSPPAPPSAFELLLQNTQLPPPGPKHFEARRRLWTSTPAVPHASPTPSQSRMKLETLLNTPGALEDDQVWEDGLNKVWKGLVGGGRLKNLLPLGIVDKILFAGWVRDGTWPAGQHVPDEDNFFGTQPQVALPTPDDLAPGVVTDNSTVPRQELKLHGH